MRCTKCGKENNEDTKFCTGCGTPMVRKSVLDKEQGNMAEGNAAFHNNAKGNKKINLLLFTAGIVLLTGIFCFVKLNFFGDSFFDKMQFLKAIRIYAANFLPLVLLVAGLILSIAALKKKCMKRGCIGLIIASLVLIASVGVFAGVNISKDINHKKLLDQNLSSENVVELQTAYSELKSQEEKDEFVKKILDKVASVKADYLDEKSSIQEVQDELNNLEKLELVQSDIDKVRELVDNVEASRTAYAKAQEYEASKEYVSALRSYEQVISEDTKNYETAQSKISEVTDAYKNALIKKVNKFSDDKKYEDAMNLLNSGENEVGKDKELETLKDKLEGSYVDSVLAQAEELKKQRKYTEATEVLNSASDIVYSAKFDNALAELENYKDVLLNTVKVVDSSGFELVDKDEAATDVFGNTYTNAYNFSVYYSDSVAYAYFNSNGYYQMFSGTFVANDDTTAKIGDKDNSYRFEVYADEELVYSSQNMVKTSQPVDFDVNIDFAKVVQVRVIHIADGAASIEGVLGNGKFHN